MRPLRSLLLLLMFVLLGGALLAPCLYQLAQVIGERVPFVRSLSEYPFERFLSRSFVIVALLALVPFLRQLGIAHRADLGFGSTLHWREAAIGAGLGFMTLALTGAILLSVQARAYLPPEAGKWVGQLIKATTAAVVVAMLEEILFRGAIFNGMRKTMPWAPALGITSLVFAFSHFFAKTAQPWTGPVGFESGFVQLGRILQGLAEPSYWWPAAFNLTLVGLVLGLAFQKTGRIYLSIGLHAGWIFWLKSFSFFTRKGAIAESSAFWGSGKLIDGFAATLVLSVCLVAMYFWCPAPYRREKAPIAEQDPALA